VCCRFLLERLLGLKRMHSSGFGGNDFRWCNHRFECALYMYVRHSLARLPTGCYAAPEAGQAATKRVARCQRRRSATVAACSPRTLIRCSALLGWIWRL